MNAVMDTIMAIIFCGICAVFLIPINILHGDNVVSNVMVPAIIIMAMVLYVFLFYDFVVSGRPKAYRGVWFFAFIIFNYLAAVIYYVMVFRPSRKCMS